MHWDKSAELEDGWVRIAVVPEPAVEGPADGGGDIGVHVVDADDVGSHSTETDGRVQAFHLDSFEHVLRAGALFLLNARATGLVLVGLVYPFAFSFLAGDLVADIKAALALGPVDEGGERLAKTVPGLGAAVHGHLARGNVSEGGVNVVDPQIGGLGDVNVAVHDFEAVVHRCPPGVVVLKDCEFGRRWRRGYWSGLRRRGRGSERGTGRWSGGRSRIGRPWAGRCPRSRGRSRCVGLSLQQ